MGEKMHLLALLLFALGPVASVPVLPSSKISVPGSDEYEENVMVRIDDMLFPSGRSAIKCADGSCFWPKSEDGTVNLPYVFVSQYSDWEYKLFKTSMDEYTSLTCVRLIPRTSEADYLNIMSSQGCQASLGRVGGGQDLAIDSNSCMGRGTIQHEINHALGFQHEHMRSDRDDYITVMFENISPDDQYNFDKADTNNLGLQYDYGSVMHYSGYAFSSTGNPTIVPKPDPNVPIGQRDGLSPLDVAKINRLYQCDVCATLLNEQKGNLSSANYPSEYPDNTNCVWLIRVPSGQVALNFLDFDLQSTTDCESDYINIYDGPSKDYPMIGNTACGTDSPYPIIASTNQLLVEFTSDSSIAGRGFTAEYNSVQCGGTYFKQTDTFTSPNYPNDYSPSLNCYYTINAPVGSTIVLSFSDFATEYIRFCGLDYLEVFDGPIIYGRFCGIEDMPTITSETNTLKVHFVTSKYYQMRGFKASYVIV